MGYQALYRRYRPARFEDFVGQEAVIKTLRSQITSGRIAHAYLFCGTRGTGKTSTAKVFARAVNCEHPENGDPCGTCDTCRALAEENSLDILEIDAASNNGVDEIRDLREKVKYPPQTGRYRVYIIDEVHMLSQGAFNALLKTLEEPPAYVVFIWRRRSRRSSRRRSFPAVSGSISGGFPRTRSSGGCALRWRKAIFRPRTRRFPASPARRRAACATHGRSWTCAFPTRRRRTAG